MAHERSEKSKYPSRYSPQKWVTAAQYIVEYVCEKKAKREQKDLPIQFWQLDDWAKFYRSQIHTANALVKKYGELPVIAALKNEKTAWMYSLRAPGFEGFIQQAKRELDVKEKIRGQAANAIICDDVVDDTTSVPIGFSPSYRKTDKLKDL